MKKRFFNVNVIHSLWIAGMMMCTCTLGLSSCSDDYDDSELRSSIEDLGDRVTTLEEWQKSVNADIESLQTLVAALENKNCITNITPVTESGAEVGYTITFQTGNPITIRHGKNGTNGQTPIIGVAQDTDGTYYWTVKIGEGQAEFLTDEQGNKIPVTGPKGDPGTGDNGLTPYIGTNGNWWIGTTDTSVKAQGDKGTDAIAPQVRINTDSNEWEISTDGGDTWTSTNVKATGEQGDKGDSLFSNIDTSNPNEVVFILADEDGTKISIPRISELLNIEENDSDNSFSVTSELLKTGTGNVVHVRVESPNADGAYIETRSIADGTRWKITSNTTDNTMTILAYPAKGVEKDETALLMVTVSDNKGNTLAKGQKVFTNSIEGGTAEVVENVTELTTALSNSNIALVALAEDVTLSNQLSVSSTTKTIDLNNQTLTSSQHITANSNGVITLKNGKISQNGNGKVTNSSGGSVILENVEYEGTGTDNCILNAENAQSTNITIKNSHIKGGYYALFTNALTSPQVGSATITLENSTFEAKETAFVMNIPGTVTVKNCTFTGGWQGVFLRGGTSTFENCAINLVMDPSYNDVPEDHKNADGTWASGNQAEGAALLIGNRCTENSTGYNYPTTVTLKNTTFTVTGTAKSIKTERKAENTPSVYIWSRTESEKGTSFTYDTASESSFKAAGSGLFIGNNGLNLTVNGSSYPVTE